MTRLLIELMKMCPTMARIRKMVMITSLFLGSAAFATYALSSDTELYNLKAEQWEITRHGERLVRVPVLRDVVNSWSQNKDHKIEIQYPGGEEGELWVEELIDWLVALGVPSHNMITVPGSGAEDIIRFKIIKVGE